MGQRNNSRDGGPADPEGGLSGRRAGEVPGGCRACGTMESFREKEVPDHESKAHDPTGDRTHGSGPAGGTFRLSGAPGSAIY